MVDLYPLLRHATFDQSAAPIEAFTAAFSGGVLQFTAFNFKATLVTKGSLRLVGDFGQLTVSTGELVLIPPGANCESISLCRVEVLVARIQPSFLVEQLRWARPPQRRDHRATYRELVGRPPCPRVVRPDANVLVKLASLLERISLLPAHPTSLSERLVYATELIWEIESLLTSCSHRTEDVISSLIQSEPIREEVRLALRLFRERHHRKLHPSEIASEIPLSESALRRAGVAVTGLTPRAYPQHIRLFRFERLVVETLLPLAQITRMVGWSSTSHARAVFSRRHGISPSEFRTRASGARSAQSGLKRGLAGCQHTSPIAYDNANVGEEHLVGQPVSSRFRQGRRRGS